MKEKVIEVMSELERDGYNIEGILLEDGIMNGNYGIVEWSFFDDIDDSKLKDYLIDMIEENDNESYI